jgi:large subunit ribosomal protein L6
VSRIGRLPITIPSGVEITIKDTYVHVKGPKGEMERTFPPMISLMMENGQLLVHRPNDDAPFRAMHGTARAVIQNMVTGVSTGFEKVLEIDGVGYRAEMNGANLVLYVGYSHPVTVEPPEGISFDVDTKTRQVFIRGKDKEQIGQVGADIRKIRPPEPYKGKGIRYQGEKIRRKAGKSGKGAKK